ncbi:MAG: hypothetical protein HC805_06840 [Alkalinema sp. RL_2_19]|nr:hypothetical protein [Alkalinema sp. RL_2_19]
MQISFPFLLISPMAQSLEQINQSLHKLEETAIELGEKLHLAHQGYRRVLAQTAHEQLIMSGFTLVRKPIRRNFSISL